MAHTAGFQEISPEYVSADSVGGVIPLPAAARVAMPGRVFPPGRCGAYSNYGAALTGYIVEVVSGMPYDEYLERFIAEPLGLDYFTIRQPVPERLQPHLTTGYDIGSGPQIPRPFQLIRSDYPAYSLTASAGDMARYMMMLLAYGELEGVRVLSFFTSATDIAAWMQGVHGAIKIGLLLTCPAVLLSLGAVYFCFRGWRHGHWSFLSRTHYTVVTAALLVFIWFCNTWNLIGWRF
jgi:CubicO group peptidase (beta-lactamase class C family)